MKISVSIGIPAHNEERNMYTLLKALTNQKTKNVHISEIIVVASGCTDRTIEKAKQFPHIQIITQKNREGKASAINAFLAQAREKICVISSADIIPSPRTIQELCDPFQNPNIGMTGAHPVPTNSKNSFAGRAAHTLWNLHHLCALSSPKCGEMIAFRRLFNSISPFSPVDEASIEAEIKSKNLQLQYVPSAIVHNKGPETVHELIQQRRRINYGHLWLKKKKNYTVSTNKKTVLPIALKNFSPNMAGLTALELYSKILAQFDYYSNKNHRAWKQLPSTKNP